MTVKFKWKMRMGCNVFVEAGLCLLQETLTGSCTYTPFLLFPYNQLSRFYKPPASLPDLPTFCCTSPSSFFIPKVWISFA